RSAVARHARDDRASPLGDSERSRDRTRSKQQIKSRVGCVISYGLVTDTVRLPLCSPYGLIVMLYVSEVARVWEARLKFGFSDPAEVIVEPSARRSATVTPPGYPIVLPVMRTVTC